MANYQEVKSAQAPCINCFFAFSNKQFEEAVKEQGLENEKIYRGPHGLYGTKQGIQDFLSFYDRMSERIAAECDPQEVYDYEFINHECGYICDDEDAIKIVVSYFGEEKAATIKRKYAYVSIKDLKF